MRPSLIDWWLNVSEPLRALPPAPGSASGFRGLGQLCCQGLLQVIQENTGGVWKCLILRVKTALRGRDATLLRDRCNAWAGEMQRFGVTDVTGRCPALPSPVRQNAFKNSWLRDRA